MNSSSYLPHQVPRLPFLHVKRFSSVDQAFETPMEHLFYKQVKGPLEKLLGGRLYTTRILTYIGYTVGKLQVWKYTQYKYMIYAILEHFMVYPLKIKTELGMWLT